MSYTGFKRIKNAATVAVTTTAVAGIVSQLGRPLASLVTLPFLIDKLGQSGTGIWMIGLSLMGLLGVLNSGLSITLVTAVARANGATGESDVNRLATAGTLIAIATAALVLTLFLPLVWLVKWTELLNVDGSVLPGDTEKMLVVLTVILAFGFLAAVPRQIMMGQLHGYIAHALDLAGIVLGSAALIVAVVTDQPLWLLALAFMGPSPLLLLVGGLLYLRKFHISMFRIQHIHRPTLSELRKDSFRMVLYHAAYSVSSQSDLLLIGTLIGAPASAVYGFAQRIFSLPILIAQAISQAQWPLMAVAGTSGNRLDLDRTLRFTLSILVTFSAVAAALIALVYQSLLEIWLGAPIETSAALLTGMVVWVPLAVAVNIYDTALRAQNSTAYLARSMLLMAAINLPSSLALIEVIGYAGALWGTMLGYFFALLIPYSIKLTPLRICQCFNVKNR